MLWKRKHEGARLAQETREEAAWAVQKSIDAHELAERHEKDIRHLFICVAALGVCLLILLQILRRNGTA